MACLASLERFPPEVSRAGSILIQRLDSPNWALEWSLPFWLGQAFGLEADVMRALTQANLFGLAYVRLQDDVIDGELASTEAVIAPAVAPLLATALYHLWLEPYRELFDAASPFWRYFDIYLAQWLRGSLRDRPATEAGRWPVVDREHALALAERGAPLKIGATGACLLADRERDVPAAEAALDHLLGAAVLIDHAQDWRQDLASGRYNAFVAYAVGRGEGAESAADVRRAVLTEAYLGDAGRLYFALVEGLLDGARDGARSLSCPGLDGYLDRLGENVRQYSNRLATETERRLRTAVAAFLAAGSDGGVSQGAPEVRRGRT
ncbi:MAG: hypothetical protein P8129_09355 [Anaerolineae bacterium]